jgi:hypothetical protein
LGTSPITNHQSPSLLFASLREVFFSAGFSS